MSILGVDLGNYSTKTSEGVIFNSRISPGHKDLNKNDIKVELDDKKYTVGSGRLELGTQRLNSKLYELCLLTAIAKSNPNKLNIETNLVVGLPPLQFESGLKDELQENLDRYGTKKIKIDNRKITITINKVTVFSEAAIVFGNPDKYKSSKTLVIDIGGGSADISQFRGLELVNTTTTKFGMFSLCENMKQKLNAQEKANYSSDDMEELINSDNTIIRGENKDISYLNDIVDDHVAEICNVCNQNFDTDNTKIILIGGGADKLIDYFKKRYRNAELAKDNQFVNAKTYATVGEMLWSEEE